ncbi:hypothetical protein MIR68_009917 [Amoeboaphelidium protococcarum]|nr:hypothetical protein MIR68_009917 [Amoeboaphelidium protococcarum]
MLANSRRLDKVWISDSGCNQFLVNSKQHLRNYQAVSMNCGTADRSGKLQLLGQGEALVALTNDDGNQVEILLQNVFYSPKLECNLFPTSLLDLAGYKTTYGDRKVTMVNSKHEQVLSGRLLDNGLYSLNVEFVKDMQQCRDPVKALIINIKNLSHQETFMRLHFGLGHPGYRTLRKMIKQGFFNNIDQSVADAPVQECDVCTMAKSTRQSFKNVSGDIRTSVPLERLHMDLIGPVQVQTPQKQKYVLVISDDYSGYTWTELLVSKDSVYQSFTSKLYPRMLIEQGNKHSLVDIQCDQGKEFLDKTFVIWAQQFGIEVKSVPRYTPQLNGTAERKNRTIIVKARCLLIGANFPNNMWGYAVLPLFSHLFMDSQLYVGLTRVRKSTDICIYAQFTLEC